MTAFSLPAGVLASTLRTIAPAIPARPNLQALSGVLIDAADDGLHLFGTNLDSAISTSCAATVTDAGRALIPFARLAEFAAVVAGDDILALTTGKGNVTLKAGRARATVQCLEVDEYPTLPEPGAVVCEVPAASFLAAVKMVALGISDDMTRPVLCGMLLDLGQDGMTLVSADGFRLHVARLTEATPCPELKLLVPGSTVEMLAKVLNARGGAVSLHAGDGNQVAFRQGPTTMVGRLIEGRFPDYRRLLPSALGRTVSFDATAWQRAYREATVYSDNHNSQLGLVIPAASDLSSSVEVILRAEAETAVDATVGRGDDATLLLDYRYLGDATLGAAKGFVLDYTGLDRPIRVQYEGPCVQYTAIVMPLSKAR